jgi:hypothetical protein
LAQNPTIRVTTVKSLQVSIISVFIGFAFLLVYEAGEYYAYYDHGASHMDSEHLVLVQATYKMSSDHPLLQGKKSSLIPPEFRGRILSAPEDRISLPLFALHDQIPSRASPVLPLNPV